MKSTIIFILLLCITSNGQSWKRVQSTFIPEANNPEVKGIFIDSLTGWCANEYLYKTIDGGREWYRVSIESEPPIYDVMFYTNQFGLCWIWDSVYKTIDGGEIWTRADSFPNSIRDIDFIDTLKGIIGSETLQYTEDGGINWQQSTVNFEKSFFVNKLQLFDNGSAYACAIKNNPYGGVVFKSIDFGKSWNVVLESDYEFINGYFLNDKYGMVVERHWEAKAYITRREIAIVIIVIEKLEI